MEDLLTATLALNTTVIPQANTANTSPKPQDRQENQSGEQRLMQEKWQFTVPLLMLGVS